MQLTLIRCLVSRAVQGGDGGDASSDENGCGSGGNVEGGGLLDISLLSGNCNSGVLSGNGSGNKGKSL